mgnify:CR=1 FL=1
MLKQKDFVVSLLFLGSVGILIYFQLLTKNQVLIFFLIPISAAYSHAYTIKYFNKKYLIYFILVIFIFTTIKYHVRFNQNRKFIELVSADFNLAEDAAKLDKRLKGLKWITPHYPNKPLNEINLLIDTKNILSEKKGEKIIITDYQFFSSMLNNKFASPNKWYDDRSIPDKKNKYYNMHKNFFLNKIKKNEIKYLFFIGKNKSEMYFFEEFLNENECVISNELNELLFNSRLIKEHITIFSIDKFPCLTDYVIPEGVRIANSHRVRLGAYLGEGTTVMHEGFINFNAGTLGKSMIEGRISQGVVVQEGSDLGGSSSTMGILSGGNETLISVGKDCLLGANSGLGIPLGDRCTVEAGLYITAGTKVEFINENDVPVSAINTYY